MKKAEQTRMYKLFREEVRRWVSALGLQDWRWDIRLTDEEDGFRARVKWDTENRIAFVELSSPWLRDGDDAGPASAREVCETALHEVLEVLLADLKNALLEHPKDQNLDTQATHAVIRRLEAFMRKRKEKI